MKIAGIIAEYNPFHLGHEHHIRETRRRCGCDYVVVCMAGSFVQRGEPARLDKWARAEMALRCGADAVFELPTAWALRTADAFALGGAAILSGLGCDALSFGSEIADMGLLERLAELGKAEPPELSAAIRRGLAEGKSHARARGEAIAEWLGIAPEILNSPNMILAVEYLRALRKLGSKMEPLAISRRGDYHGETPRVLAKSNSPYDAQGATPSPENCDGARQDSASISCTRDMEGCVAHFAGVVPSSEDCFVAQQAQQDSASASCACDMEGSGARPADASSAILCALEGAGWTSEGGDGASRFSKNCPGAQEAPRDSSSASCACDAEGSGARPGDASSAIRCALEGAGWTGEGGDGASRFSENCPGAQKAPRDSASASCACDMEGSGAHLAEASSTIRCESEGADWSSEGGDGASRFLENCPGAQKAPRDSSSASCACDTEGSGAHLAEASSTIRCESEGAGWTGERGDGASRFSKNCPSAQEAPRGSASASCACDTERSGSRPEDASDAIRCAAEEAGWTGGSGAGVSCFPEDRRGARQEFASASAIRAMLGRGEMEAALAWVPGVVRGLLAAAPGMHAPDDLLLHVLRSMSEAELAALPDVGEGLEHRLARCAREATSLAELIDMLKCKRYTRARLTRLCAHALLGVTREFLGAHPLPEYARLLGMREDARPLLAELSRRATLPIASDPVKLRDAPIFQLECRATDLRALCCDDPEERRAGQELVRKFVRI